MDTLHFPTLSSSGSVNQVQVQNVPLDYKSLKFDFFLMYRLFSSEAMISSKSNPDFEVTSVAAEAAQLSDSQLFVNGSARDGGRGWEYPGSGLTRGSTKGDYQQARVMMVLILATLIIDCITMIMQCTPL